MAVTDYHNIPIDTDDIPDYSPAEVKAWQEQANNAIVVGETLRAKYAGKIENMTADDEEKFDKAYADADRLTRRIGTAQKALSVKTWGKSMQGAGLPMGGGSGGHISGESVIISGRDNKEAVYKSAQMKAYREYLRGQTDTSWGQNTWMHTKEVKAYSAMQMSDEFKAYQADNPTGGGFAVPPQELVAQYIVLIKNLVFMHNLSTNYQLSTAESLGVPAIDTDPSDSDWTVELGTGNEETTAAVGKREFRPHPVAKRILMSKKLLRQVPSVETVIMDRLAYKMGVTLEKAYLTGTGADQPLGIFTPSANGIPTSRDVTAASATTLAGDDFISTFYNLVAGYRRNAVWIMNRTVVAATRKLKDANGNYLWTTAIPGTVGATVTGPGGGLQGTPEMLMGRPLFESEFSPSTISTTSYVAVVGNMDRYWTVDALDMQIQTLYELYAATNQMGYLLRAESDGVPVLGEAFSRLQMHS